ncbi:MAG: 30S ribosomal protein S4 [Candidatus Lokiarchaeota archaeon]|nr:30S ribosomal protein S4 [Candidatus Lokiarchaeota archaeon]
MGDPRRQQKHYVIPKRPFDSDRFESELQLIGTYGLRNKKELWIHRTKLSDYRRQARNILALPPEERHEPTKELIKKLERLGVLSGEATLDTVLDLTVEDLLERRLQTIVFKKGMASSLHHARQLVAHGHIALDRARVMTPSRIIKTSEQELIDYAPGSPLNDESHPARVAAAETAEMMAETGGPSRDRYNEPGQPD